MMTVSSAVFTGCMGLLGRSNSEDDPFPEELDDRVRGEDSAVSVTTDRDVSFDDASHECVEAVRDGVRQHLNEKLGERDDVGTGFLVIRAGESNSTGLSVSLTAEIYDRDGDLTYESDLELDEVRAATPRTAVLRTEDGTEICAVPVYVDEESIYME